jgi:putative DNA primase/helicase
VTDRERPLFPPPTAPLDVAHKLYSRYRHGSDGLRTLLAWRCGWMRWHGAQWSEMDVAELRSSIYDTLGGVDYNHPIREKGVTVDYEIRPWSPDKHKVADVIEAMAAIGHLSTDIDPPSWISPRSVKTAAPQMISCSNGLLDLSTRQMIEHTPALFNVVSVPFDYQPNAAEPTVWLEFLASVWPDDPQSILLLQEYVGYVLSGRTDMQKMLLLIGPTRSGKGTITRMLTELIGRGHVAGPTLASLGTNFGLSPLLGKPLAVISDARLGNTPTHAVVERLLSITGEDMLTVDRKFKDPWSGKLPTRFVVLSNELPRFRDSSGAIANRLLILQMTKSFLGREDRTLDERLRAELPGILVWALDGLDRLNDNGRFTVPGSSEDAASLMMDLASPVSAFVRDCCGRGPDVTVAADDLYGAWKSWAEDNGHRPGAKSTFGRDLRAVVPEVKLSQPTVAGVRVRTYAHIALLPVHPVHGDETARQGVAAGSGDPVHNPVHQDLFRACTGCGSSSDPVNPLVNGLCTGCTGKSAFKAEKDGCGRPRMCPGCGTYVLQHGLHRDDCTATANGEHG